MRELVFTLDMTKPPGQRLSAVLRSELAKIAPSVLLNESVTTAKLRAKAVTTGKLADGSVTSPKIATGGVKTVNLDTGAVTSAKIGDGQVTATQAGVGVMIVRDAAGNARACTQVFLTTAEFESLTVQDPNTVYDLLD